MRAGQLTRSITIERKGSGTDDVGFPSAAPETVATAWANIRYLSGSEAIKGGAETSMAKVSIRIRYRTGIDAGMRVKYGATVYEIHAVLPDEQRREYLDLVCEVVS